MTLRPGEWPGDDPAVSFRSSLERFELDLRDPFRIGRPEPDREVTTVIVEAFTTDDEPVGPAYGEAFPVAYYGETPATIEVVEPVLRAAIDHLGPLPERLDEGRHWLWRASRAMDDAIRHHGGAKCGLDICLHDLLAKKLDLPLWQLLGTSPEIPPTDFSIGIDDPASVAERARRASDFPALKIKVGGPADLETLEAVRVVYGGPIRVDANTAWSPEDAVRFLPELERLGVELIEQPFPAHEHGQLRWLQERSPLPIVADESAVTEDDLPGLQGVVAGINVKLTKCGGVGPALRMMMRARELGFRVMLGCMEETSVGIAAAAAVASVAEWVDLDGNLLLSADPFEGLELGPDKRWRLGDAPGLGIARGAAG